MSSCYDLLIVGAGPAGLRVGIEALQQHPTLRCCILEKYNYIGGRVVTYHKDLPGVGKIQWENGAGRISRSHQRVLSLLRKYGLSYSSIDGTTAYLPQQSHTLQSNSFYQFHDAYLQPLRLLSHNILATHTIGQLLEKTLGVQKARNFYIQFPYYSEIHVLRADLALEAFDTEMKSNQGFVTCNQGYQAIMKGMLHEFTEKGGIVLQEMEVVDVQQVGEHAMEVLAYESGCHVTHKGKHKGTNRIKRVFQSTSVVLALHQTALKQIKSVSRLPILRHLAMPPLLRMYAVFPKQHKQVWFDDLPKIVTDSRLRYILPYHKEKGILMISYTEGPDAKYWMNMPSDQVEQRVMQDIRSLFPDREIPDPLFFKMHPWTDGCTYWLPGNYDPLEESRRSLSPIPSMPSLFLCSESFSIHQSWVESALEQADALLALPSFQKTLRT